MTYGVVIGIGLGYYLAQSRNNKIEVKQCEHHRGSSFSQIGRIARFTWEAGRVITIVPYVPYRIGVVACNALFPAASTLIGQQEDNKQLMRTLAYAAQAAAPDGIDPSRITLLFYFVENYKRVANVGVLVGAVALPYLGYSAFAARIALPVVYGAVAANVVPAPISRFVVRNLVSTVMWTGGIICTQIYSFVALPRGVSERTDDFLKKISKFLFQKKASAPEEIEMRCMQPGVLSLAEINFILENDDKVAYKMNLPYVVNCVQAGFLGGLEDIHTRCSLILFCILRKSQDDQRGRGNIFALVGVEDRGRFIDYMSKEITSLVNITMEQKENLVEKLNRFIGFPGVLEGYLRLFFVMQGVLKIRPIGTDWVVIIGPTDELGFAKVEDGELGEWSVMDRKVSIRNRDHEYY